MATSFIRVYSENSVRIRYREPPVSVDPALAWTETFDATKKRIRKENGLVVPLPYTQILTPRNIVRREDTVPYVLTRSGVVDRIFDMPAVALQTAIINTKTVGAVVRREDTVRFQAILNSSGGGIAKNIDSEATVPSVIGRKGGARIGVNRVSKNRTSVRVK